MAGVFALILPVYVIVIAGFLAVRFGVVQGAELSSLGRIVLRLLLPATLFLAVARQPLSQALDWGFLCAYALGSLAAYALAFAIARGFGQDRTLAGLEAMGSACSNSAYFGLPVITLAYGPDLGLRVFALVVLVENIVVVPVAVAVLEAGRSGGWRVVQTALRGPLLIASCAGLAFSATGFVLPQFLEKALQMLAPVAAPVALLVIGGAVAGMGLRAVGGAVWRIVPLKLLVHPALVAAVMLAFGQPADLTRAAILNAAVPMMGVYALFGLQYGREGMAASALILATLGSFFTLSGLIALL